MRNFTKPAASVAIKALLAFVAQMSAQDLGRLLQLAERAAPDKSAKEEIRAVQRLWQEGHPLGQLVYRGLCELSPHCRERSIINLVVNAGWLGGKRRALLEEMGLHVPFTYLISPTTRCNLRCAGCYAGEYSVKDDLPLELIDRVLSWASTLSLSWAGSPLSAKICGTSMRNIVKCSFRSSLTAPSSARWLRRDWPIWAM